MKGFLSCAHHISCCAKAIRQGNRQRDLYQNPEEHGHQLLPDRENYVLRPIWQITLTYSSSRSLV